MAKPQWRRAALLQMTVASFSRVACGAMGEWAMRQSLSARAPTPAGWQTLGLGRAPAQMLEEM
jgi:hypothetical protein